MQIILEFGFLHSVEVLNPKTKDVLRNFLQVFSPNNLCYLPPDQYPWRHSGLHHFCQLKRSPPTSGFDRPCISRVCHLKWYSLCLRENPHSESHANVEGNGWKKAPPCCCGASLNSEGGTEAHRPGCGRWCNCQELEAEELLTFPFICTFYRTCAMHGGVDVKINSEGRAFRKQTVCYRMDFNANVCVWERKWKRN